MERASQRHGPVAQRAGKHAWGDEQRVAGLLRPFSDIFQGRLCNGYKLPCDVSDLSNCVSTAQADEVFRAGDWEWNYYWRTNPNAALYIQLVEGLFIGGILSRFQDVADGKSSTVYSHVFIHDNDLGPVPGTLGINQLRWPAMGSNIAFEIWWTEGKTGGLFARVLYSGQPMIPISRIQKRPGYLVRVRVLSRDQKGTVEV
jgi:hypothetical protein